MCLLAWTVDKYQPDSSCYLQRAGTKQASHVYLWDKFRPHLMEIKRKGRDARPFLFLVYQLLVRSDRALRVDPGGGIALDYFLAFLVFGRHGEIDESLAPFLADRVDRRCGGQIVAGPDLA